MAAERIVEGLDFDDRRLLGYNFYHNLESAHEQLMQKFAEHNLSPDEKSVIVAHMLEGINIAIYFSPMTLARAITRVHPNIVFSDGESQ